MRSAEFTTHFQPDIAYASPKNASRTFKPAFSFFESLKNPFGMFDQKVKLWSSKRYVDAALLNKDRLTELLPTIQNELRPDLKTFFDEYAAFFPVVTYEYGVNGLQRGYSQSMTQIAEHHLQEQSIKGLPTERAQMEMHVAQAIETWMKTPDLPTGSKLMGVSPRGAKAEGYPGTNKKNYIFINIFEKTESGFMFRQYRSYDTLNQTQALQAEALNKLGGKISYAAPETQQRKDLHAIASLISFGSEIHFSQLEPLIYAHKKDWSINIDTDLPQLNGTAYPEIAEKAVQFCLQQFESLVSNPDFSESASGHFTLLVTTVKEALTKWVETHATNYQSSESGLDIDFNQVVSVWKTRCAVAEGQKLDKEQRGLLNEFQNLTALNPSLPLNSLTSWAHCIVGSPASLMKLTNPEMMSALKMNDFSHAQIAQMIGSERAALWHEGACVRCGDATIVGECSICMKCELELGGQLTSDAFASAESDFLDTLSGEDKHKAKQLFNTLSKLVFRDTVSPEQLLHGDFVNPSATIDQEIEPLFNRLFFAHNGLAELESIVTELSGQTKDSEHTSLSTTFDFPKPKSNSQTLAA